MLKLSTKFIDDLQQNDVLILSINPIDLKTNISTQPQLIDFMLENILVQGKYFLAIT